MREPDGSMRSSNTEPTLFELVINFLSIIFAYRWIIIGITAAAAAGVIAYCIVTIRLPPEKSPLPNQYTAQAIILVQQGAQGNLAATILASLGIEPGGDSVAPAGYDGGALLTMVLHSRSFLDTVVEEFGIINKYGIREQAKSRSRELLQRKMATTYDRTTRSISISFTDIDPVFARDVTNRIVSLLNEWFIRSVGNLNFQQKQMLEEKVNEVKASIDTLENHLKALQNKYGVLTAQELGTTQASALAELRSQLILKEIDIKNYSTFSAIVDPKLQQLREERQNILDLISKFQSSVPVAQKNSDDQNNLADVQMEFNNLTVELDVQRKIYSTLSHQHEVLKLTSEPAQAFEVLELAEVPDRKSGPQRLRIVMEITLAGFMGSVVLAFLLRGVAQVRKRAEKNTLLKRGIR
jgi:tyrosine-protein kinase Etk/Wzc